MILEIFAWLVLKEENFALMIFFCFCFVLVAIKNLFKTGLHLNACELISFKLVVVIDMTKLCILSHIHRANCILLQLH